MRLDYEKSWSVRFAQVFNQGATLSKLVIPAGFIARVERIDPSEELLSLLRADNPDRHAIGCAIGAATRAFRLRNSTNYAQIQCQNLMSAWMTLLANAS